MSLLENRTRAVSMSPSATKKRRYSLSIMKRALLIIAVVVLYVLHQDFWFWRTPHPIVFGFIPIGLFYHACFAVAVSLLMWMLVKFAWPSHLEDETEQHSPVTEDHAS